MYDISPNGQRFLMIKNAEVGNQQAATVPGIILVQNWQEELKQRAPAK